MSNSLNHKNLKLLWWMRNIALVAQSFAIVVATKFLELELAQDSLWLILAITTSLNIVTFWRIKTAPNITNHEFLLQLLIDVTALAGMLYFSGGASNPFASLFILQVVIAAITLPALYTWIVAIFAVILYSLLMFWHVEIPHFMHHNMGSFFNLHVQGMWLSFLLLALIIAWFVVRMNNTIRHQEALIAEAEKIATIGTLATNAAHELGTPLATMALLAENYKEEVSEKFFTEITRCKNIISRITELGGVARSEGATAMNLDEFLTQIIDDWKKQNPTITIKSTIEGVTIKIVAEQILQQAIFNLLNNAADASPNFVEFSANWTVSNLNIFIKDRGEGLPKIVESFLGKIGVTTKPDGLGLGLFLVKNVIMRLEGKFEFVKAKDGGTVAVINLPLKKLII